MTTLSPSQTTSTKPSKACVNVKRNDYTAYPPKHQEIHPTPEYLEAKEYHLNMYLSQLSKAEINHEDDYVHVDQDGDVDIHTDIPNSPPAYNPVQTASTGSATWGAGVKIASYVLFLLTHPFTNTDTQKINNI